MIFTRFQHRKFTLSRQARAVFFETPEAADVIPKIEQAGMAEYATGITLDDTKYTSKESAEKGEVKKLMDAVKSKAEANIPGPLKLKAATAALQKLGGPDAKGTGAALKSNIHESFTTEQWLKVKDYISLTDAPPSLADAIKKAKTPTDARLACDQFESDWTKSESQFKAANEIEDYKNEMTRKIEQSAMISVEQKQRIRFEAAKKDFILRKNNVLFPNDPKEDQEKLENKRKFADAYLSGLLANLDLKIDKKDIESEFKDAYENAGGDKKVKSFVESLGSGTTGDFWKDDKEAGFYASASPEVKAYMEGVLDSAASTEPGAKRTIKPEDWAMIRDAYQLIPENQRNSLTALQSSFESLKPQMNFEKECANYIEAKVLELYPDNPQDGSLDLRRSNARIYLDGLFRAVDFTSKTKSLRENLDEYYSLYDASAIRTFVDGVMVADDKVPTYAKDPRFSEMFAKTSPDVHIFLEGVINSFAYKHKDGTINIDPEQEDWIIKRFNTIPDGQQTSIDYVQGVFSKFQARNASWMSDTDDPEMPAARKMLVQDNPEIEFFLETRMAKAEQTFLGKTGGRDALGRYRTMLFKAIAKQDPSHVDMVELNALPMPVNFETGAEKVEGVPGNVVEVSNLPKGFDDYAKKLTARMEATGGPKPVIVKIDYNGAQYYAISPPYTVYQEKSQGA